VPLETIYDEIGKRAFAAARKKRIAHSNLSAVPWASANLRVASSARWRFTALRTIRRVGRSAGAHRPPSVRVRAPRGCGSRTVLLSEEKARRSAPFTWTRCVVSGAAEQSGQRLGDVDKTRGVFSGLRTCCLPQLHVTLADLEDIAMRRGQLTRQERLHHWLHGWLLLHVPLYARIDFARRHFMPSWRCAIIKKPVARTRTTKKLAQRIDLQLFSRGDAAEARNSG